MHSIIHTASSQGSSSCVIQFGATSQHTSYTLSSQSHRTAWFESCKTRAELKHFVKELRQVFITDSAFLQIICGGRLHLGGRAIPTQPPPAAFPATSQTPTWTSPKHLSGIAPLAISKSSIVVPSDLVKPFRSYLTAWSVGFTLTAP